MCARECVYMYALCNIQTEEVAVCVCMCVTFRPAAIITLSTSLRAFSTFCTRKKLTSRPVAPVPIEMFMRFLGQCLTIAQKFVHIRGDIGPTCGSASNQALVNQECARKLDRFDPVNRQCYVKENIMN